MRLNEIPEDKKLTIKLEELAKQAYFDYGTVTDHKNYQGLPMPSWDDLPEQIKKAWIMAGELPYPATSRLRTHPRG